MNSFAHIKGKYLGHEKNPFHQFSQLMSATTDLPGEIRKNQEMFVGLLGDLRTGKQRSAPRELLAFQILNELKCIDEESWTGKYLTFLSDLKSSRYWIEDTLSASRTISESENTIFSPQPFHFHDTILARKLENHAKLRTFDSTRARLSSLISHLNSRLSKGDRAARIQNFLTNHALLDALSEINYEITDNANCHALKTAANSNYQDSGDEAFFGNMLYLQFHNFSRTNVPKIKIRETWPPDVVKYVRGFVEAVQLRDARFVMTSFVDNGPGILEHVRRHSEKCVGSSLSIKTVIADRISTRRIPGAGQGLSRVLAAMRELRGLMVLTSGSRRYIFCGLRKEEWEHEIDNHRGTMYTLLVPV